jgi:multidrug efflux pump subunit AcrB
MLGVTLGFIVVSATLYIWIPKGFFPEQDVGFLFGQAEVRQDSSFFALRKTASQVSDILLTDPDVAAVAAFGGANSSNPFENVVRMFVQLKPFEERTSSARQVIQRLRPKVAKVEGAFVFLQPAQDIMVGGKPTKTLYQFSLTDTDSNELYHWAPILQAELAKLKPLQDVTSDQQIASPHLGVVVDRDAAYRMGLSLSLIDETLYDAFGQRQVTTIYTSTNQYKVILEVQPEFQSDQTALERIFIPGPSGGQIPLSAVAHFTSSVQPLTVNHQGQFPAVTLSFNLTPGYSIGQAVDAVNAALVQLHTPPALQGAFQGTAQAFRASLSSTPLLVAAAILVVYIVLGMLYESYIHPITILSALPSAGVGALIMLMVCGFDLSVIAIIGIILLIGIVKKNAIMMIDFALEAERNEGKSPLEAIHQACLLRFRPIMMTTMAALFGGLPLALGAGAGSELRQPLGVAIVGGLLVSQVLTLYTTPIVYLYLDRLAARLSGRARAPAGRPLPEPGRTLAE